MTTIISRKSPPSPINADFINSLEGSPTRFPRQVINVARQLIAACFFYLCGDS